MNNPLSESAVWKSVLGSCGSGICWRIFRKQVATVLRLPSGRRRQPTRSRTVIHMWGVASSCRGKLLRIYSLITRFPTHTHTIHTFFNAISDPFKKRTLIAGHKGVAGIFRCAVALLLSQTRNRSRRRQFSAPSAKISSFTARFSATAY